MHGNRVIRMRGSLRILSGSERSSTSGEEIDSGPISFNPEQAGTSNQHSTPVHHRGRNARGRCAACGRCAAHGHCAGRGGGRAGGQVTRNVEEANVNVQDQASDKEVQNETMVEPEVGRGQGARCAQGGNVVRGEVSVA